MTRSLLGRAAWVGCFLVLTLPLGGRCAGTERLARGERRPESVFAAYSFADQRAQDATLRSVALAPNAPAHSSADHRRWTSSPPRPQATDAVPQRRAIAVGDFGVILRSGDDGRRWTAVDSPRLANLSDVIWIDERRIVAVGGWIEPVTGESHAAVVTSRDGGQTFVAQPDQDLPMLDRLSRSLETDDPTGLDSPRVLAAPGHVYATGDWSPIYMTDRFSTRDGGVTWQPESPSPESRSSGGLNRQPSPRRDKLAAELGIRGQSDRVGNGRCAVGDHGSIWWREPGQSRWQPVRGVGRRPAVVVIASSAHAVPWASIGEETLVRFHRVELIVVGNAPPGQRRRLRQAASALMVAGVDFVETTDDAFRHACRRRPDVIASDGLREPSAIEDAKLLAAQAGIKRLVQYSLSETRFALSETMSGAGETLLPTLGQLRRDLSADAVNLVSPGDTPHDRIDCRVIWSQDDRSGSVSRAFTDHLELDPAARLINRPVNTSRHRLQVAMARASLRKRILGWIEQATRADTVGAELSVWLNQCDRADRSRMATAVYRTAVGRVSSPITLEFEAQLLQAIASELPRQPIGRWAAWRSERLMAARNVHSARVPWRDQDPPSGLATVSHDASVSPFPIASHPSIASSPPIASSPSGRSIGLVGPVDSGIRIGVASSAMARSYSTQRQNTGSSNASSRDSLRWASDPAVVLSRASGAIGEDIGKDGAVVPDGTMGSAGVLEQDPRWSHLVRSGRDVLAARQFSARPVLDGSIHEWDHDSVSSPDLMLGWDQEFLYVSASFSAPQFKTNQKNVTRDACDRGLPRWCLRLDGDRDLVASVDLMIDAAGQTFDGVAGDSSMDPAWYFAMADDSKDAIRVEAAIEWDSLGVDPVRVGDRWYVSSQLLLPGENPRGPWIPDPALWRLVRFER